MTSKGSQEEYDLPRDAVMEKLWKKVEKTPTCWFWTGTKNSDGYGLIAVGVRPGGKWKRWRMAMVHRLAYEEVHGEIAADLHIDHLCRTRSCVNPAHLEAVTPGENIRRGVLPYEARRFLSLVLKLSERPYGSTVDDLISEARLILSPERSNQEVHPAVPEVLPEETP